MPGFVLSPAVLAAFIALLFGLIVGSFANVVIHRLPLGQSVVFPASRCPKCGSAIKPWQNLPVISWLFLRGRCAQCREPISARYPLVEALHGLGFGLIVWNFGPYPFTLLLLVFFSALVILALIDWDHQILPDVITLPGVLIGIAGSFLPGALVDWRESGVAAGFGYVAFFLVAEGYARLRGIEGLGQGDWKLAAMMGAFLGVQRLMLTVFLASLSGMIYGLVQAFRLRAVQSDSTSILAVAGDAVAAAEPPIDATPAPLPDVEPVPETSNPGPTTDDRPHLPEEPVSIGKYKLPFGTFLAASAIFVLFRGDAILLWYASFFRF
jgi:leader peptidase (prepilin peptidase)/N-methyltransferase